MGTEGSYGGFDASEDVWEFPVADFLVLARPDVPGLYILNPSAKLLWELRQRRLPFADLVREFASAYDISLELAARDITRTLEHWGAGLLSKQSDPTQRNFPAQIPALASNGFFAENYLVQGKKVRVILETPELAEEILPRLEPLPHAPSDPDFTFRVAEDPDGFRIYCGRYSIASEETVGAARAVLFQEIVRACRGVDCLAVFHAGACGSSSRCVVFPATTQAGKTTLAAVLMKQGLTLYSDDSVLLERDTLAVPAMPSALMIREGSWGVLSPRFPELQDTPIISRYGQRVRFLRPIGMKAEGHSERVGALVFVRFSPESANQIQALDPMQTLLRLQESGFWVAHDQPSIGAFLAWLQSTASYALSYSDVDGAASTIRSLIE